MTPQSKLQEPLDPDLLNAAYSPAVRKTSRTFDKHQPDNTDWSLDRIPELQREFASQFGRALPLVNKGQGSIHNRWGYDHRNSADVSINPASSEGQRFSAYLRSKNIPFLAFDRPVAGVSTGRHYHIGFPSSKTSQRFGIGAQQKRSQQAALDPDLMNAGYGEQEPAKQAQSPALDPDLMNAAYGPSEFQALAPSLTTNDTIWHFGEKLINLSPKARQVLSAQVADDQRKKSTGQSIPPPPLKYQNEMRVKAGLKPLKFNMEVDENKPSPYYQPETKPFSLGEGQKQITVRPKSFEFNVPSDEDVRTSIRQSILASQTQNVHPEARSEVNQADVDSITEQRFQQYIAERDQALEIARKGPSVSARNNRSERIGAAINDVLTRYAPGLAAIDAPAGIKTDVVRGAARGIGLPVPLREVTKEERLIRPNAQADKELAEFVGQNSTAFLPYVGAGKLVSVAGVVNPVLRDALTFGIANATTQLTQTGTIDPNTVAESILTGGVMGKIAGVDPSLKRRLVAYIAPQLAASVAKGEHPDQIIQSVVTNGLFALAGGKRETINPRRVNEAKVETQPNVTTKFESAEPIQSQARSGMAEPVEANRIVSELVSESAPPRHVDLQPRRVRNTETGKAGRFKSETRAQAEERRVKVNQPAQTEPQAPSVSTPTTVQPEGKPTFDASALKTSRGRDEAVRQITNRVRGDLGEEVRLTDSERVEMDAIGKATPVDRRLGNGRRENERRVRSAQPQSGSGRLDVDLPGSIFGSPRKLLDTVPRETLSAFVNDNLSEWAELSSVESRINRALGKHFKANLIKESSPLISGTIVKDLSGNDAMARLYNEALKGRFGTPAQDKPYTTVREIAKEYLQGASPRNEQRVNERRTAKERRVAKSDLRQPKPVATLPVQPETVKGEGKAEFEAYRDGTIRRAWPVVQKTFPNAEKLTSQFGNDLSFTHKGTAYDFDNADAGSPLSGAFTAKNGESRITGQWKTDGENKWIALRAQDGSDLTPAANLVEAKATIEDYFKNPPKRGTLRATANIEGRQYYETSDGQRLVSGVKPTERVVEPESSATPAKAETPKAATPELQKYADQATAVRQKLTPQLTTVERSALERKAKRLEAKARGEELRHSGADPYELIDDLIIRGGELIREGKKAFDEWSRKMREEFGKDADPHLRKIWKSLRDESQLPEATSVKNEATAELRADLGLLEMERPERKTWETTIDNALAKGLDKKAESIADDVVSGKNAEGLTDEQSAGIQHRMRELENQWEDVYVKNPTDTKLTDIEKRLDNLSKAVDMGGTAPARALSFRRSAKDKEFKLINLIQQAKKAYGRELTPKERTRYEEIVKERDQAVKERDAALEKLHTKRLQNELDRAARVRVREGSKKALDEEAVVIKQDIAAEFARIKSQMSSTRSMGGLGSLDPDGIITRNLLRYARNRAKANVGLKAEALIDEVHGLVSDFGVTRRQIAEILSGYGRQPIDRRSEAARRLAEIRSEITSLLKAEDVATGARTEKRQGPENAIKRNQRRLDQLLKQEKEWERKFNERDFERRRKPEPYPYNSDVRRAEDRVRIAEAKFKREMERARPGHQIRNLSGVMKSWLLSGPPTQAMNIIGTGSYQGLREVARLPAAIGDAIWSAGRQVTGHGAQRSITGPSPSAMLDSVIQSGKVGGRQFLEIMKHGATKEQMERHQYQEIDFGVNTGKKVVDNGVKVIELAHNAIFRFMSGSDRVFFQGAYKRNLIDRARVQALNEGVSDVKARTKELVENPPEQLEADAKHDALVATFNNNNWLSTKIKRARSAVVDKQSLMTEKSAQRLNAVENLAMDFVLPFDRTPTNVVSRIVEASPLGYGKNVAQLVAAVMRKSMPVEHQRQFFQTFGNATAGTTLMALGWYLADQAKGIIAVDGYDVFLKIPGLPKINLRTASPAGNILAAGARLRVAHQDKDSIWGDYAKPALREAGNIPILRAGSPITELVRDPERSGPKTAARFASMAVPFGGAVRWAGQLIDPAERRYPDNSFKEQFQKGIPAWRESLPASRARLLGSESTPVVAEVERLGMNITGVVRQPDEPQDEFTKRRAFVNPYIRRALEKVVAMPDYHKDSDENKLERLKQAKEVAQKEGQAAYDAIPRPQKFEKQKQVHPVPSGAPQSLNRSPWLPPRNPFKSGSEAFRERSYS